MPSSEAERIPWEATGVGRLPCKATEGLWPGEYSLEIDVDGKAVGLTARENEVRVLGSSDERGEDAELRVHVVGLSGQSGWVVVRLPRETWNSGPIIEVPRQLLQGEFKDALMAVGKA